MTLIAHLSDPHLGPLAGVRLGELMSKRAIGYINWRTNRGHGFEERTLSALTGDLRAAHPDHIAVTGDLVNIGIEAEYDAALAWLHTLGAPHDVTVVPGNHDAYVARAVAHYASRWLPFASGDEAHPAMTFPFVRRRGPIALIGLSTANPTAPFMATGKIDAGQAARFGEALAATRDLCRVVLIHHPPYRNATRWTRRLIGADRVRAAIARQGAELVLHGHNHKIAINWLDGADGPVPVVGAAALAAAARGSHAGGSYNLIRISGERRPYDIRLTVRGLAGGDAVTTVLERKLDQPTATHA